jgi:hypothetical protein
VPTARIKTWFATSAAAAVVVVAGVAGVVAAPPAAAAGSYNPSMAAQFVSYINSAREQHGLRPYTVASDLTANADSHAMWMSDHNTMEDDQNVGNEVCCWESIGENSGEGPTVQALNTAFMDSPPHRANILDPSFTQVGVGVVVNGQTIWVAEVFRQPMGQPQPPPPAPKPTQQSAPPAQPAAPRPTATQNTVNSSAAAPAPTYSAAPPVRHTSRRTRVRPSPTASARLAAAVAAASRRMSGADPLDQALRFTQVMGSLL